MITLARLLFGLIRLLIRLVFLPLTLALLFQKTVRTGVTFVTCIVPLIALLIVLIGGAAVVIWLLFIR